MVLYVFIPLLFFLTSFYSRSELGLVMMDGCVYAVGGWEGRSRLDSVER